MNPEIFGVSMADCSDEGGLLLILVIMLWLVPRLLRLRLRNRKPSEADIRCALLYGSEWWALFCYRLMH